MKHIKLFENFNYRKPKMISDEDYQKKFDTHGTEPFTQEESDFFLKLHEENTYSIYDMFLENDFVTIQLYPSGDNDDFDEVCITKLKDHWFLITENGSTRFECDEWNEVLGYLGSQLPLKF